MNKQHQVVDRKSGAETPQLLTVCQAAAVLSVSKSFMYELAASRRIPSYKIGRGAIRFASEDLLDYLAQCRVETHGTAPHPVRPAGTGFQHLNGSRLVGAWRQQGDG